MRSSNYVRYINQYQWDGLWVIVFYKSPLKNNAAIASAVSSAREHVYMSIM